VMVRIDHRGEVVIPNDVLDFYDQNIIGTERITSIIDMPRMKEQDLREVIRSFAPAYYQEMREEI
jgi:hypothetical protein